MSGLFPLIPNVAVITMKGRIGRAIRPDDVGRQLHLAGRIPVVRGVLLRIDSPGSDASDSEEIRAEVERLKEHKPVVAHINRVGASGGYLIASAANKVVASKWALVGSIGVLLMRPNVTDLMDRLGVGVVVRKTGRFKDLGSPFRLPTAEDEEKERELIGVLFDDFVATVAAGRGLDDKAVKQLATGEVFTGAQAKEVALVDEIGDEHKATDLLEEMIGSPTRSFEIPVPGGFSVTRLLRPAALFDRFAGPFASLSFRPRLEWPGGGPR